MKPRYSLLLACAGLLAPSSALAGEEPLPSPLDAPTVVRLAHQRRPEITAARARWAAAAEHPKVVSALPDPTVIASLDHLPFSMMGFDGSLSVEQEFPLSGILGDRRRSAEAEAERWGADARRVALDVELEALEAFYMLAERRSEQPILDEQIALVEQLVIVARAHLAAGQGMEADVLRLDNERARLVAQRDALVAEVKGAEAMLDTSLARWPGQAIPPLAWSDDRGDPPPLDELTREALARRPELAGVRAQRKRAAADIDEANAMYAPTALVRAGPAYSMLEGAGVMAMVGVSVPLWRERLGAGVAEARAMETMATADEDAMRRMFAGSVASARATVVAERTRWLALTREIVPRARVVVQSATGSFGAGQGPMVAVLDAARDLRDVRTDEVMARARLGEAWAKLQRATGRLDASAP